MTLNFFSHDREYDIIETGHFILDKVKTNELKSGEVGYVVASVFEI